MRFINPCKRCITRAVCKNKCKDFVEFGCTTHNWTYFLWFTFLFLSFLSITVLLYMNINPLYASFHVLNLLWFGYYKSIKETLKDIDNLKEYKIWKQWIIWGFGPLILFTTITWDKLPVDNLIDNFIYKYNKKVKSC